MTTTGTVILVGGVGVAVFLFMRSKQQQSYQVQAAAAGMPAPSGGGGIGGLTTRLWSQFKSDPLGIEQHKDTAKTVYNIGKTAVNSVGSAASDVVSFIGGIF